MGRPIGFLGDGMGLIEDELALLELLPTRDLCLACFFVGAAFGMFFGIALAILVIVV